MCGIKEVNDGQSLSPLAEQEDKLASEEQGGKVQQNSAGGDEDSEWLDYSAKPAIPEVSFKEYQELSDEETDKGEDNGRTPDTTKTWNVAGVRGSVVTTTCNRQTPQGKTLCRRCSP